MRSAAGVSRVVGIACMWATLAVPGVMVGAEPDDTSDATLPPPSEVGRWEVLPVDSPIMPIHAALLRTGRVWLGSGSANDAARFAAGDFRSALWDPVDGSFTEIATPWDLFCAGHAFLPDGRLLIAGGTSAYPADGVDFKGLRDAYAFDPREEHYEPLPMMARGRWYPSLVALGNGRVYAISGLDQTGSAMNHVPESFDPVGSAWRPKHESRGWPMYPALFLTEDRRLFYSGGYVAGRRRADAGSLDIGTGVLTPVPGLRHPGGRDQSASVLLPPAQRQQVMIMGGGSFPNGDSLDAVDIIDLTAAVPAYRPGPPLLHPRMHVSAVLLPDRTVLVTGGGASRESAPVLDSEIYDPRSDAWRAVAPASVARLYHSLALLLPNGRVLVAGSNPPGHMEHRVEIYSPPYLFQGRRPVIRESPVSIRRGTTAEIRTSQAASIRWVSLIRPSAVTHSTDTEQRVIHVPSRLVAAGTLELTIPASASIAPPGWYMLFVTNEAGVPGVANWVRLH